MSKESPKPEQLKEALSVVAPQKAETLSKQYEYVMDNINATLTTSNKDAAIQARNRVDLLAKNIIKSSEIGISNIEYEQKRQELISTFSRELMNIEAGLALLTKSPEVTDFSKFRTETGLNNFTDKNIEGILFALKPRKIGLNQVISYIKQIKTLKNFDNLKSDPEQLRMFLVVAIDNLKAKNINLVQRLLSIDSSVASLRSNAIKQLSATAKKLKSAQKKLINYKPALPGIKADPTILKLEADVATYQKDISELQCELYIANIRHDLAMEFLAKNKSASQASIDRILNTSSVKDFEALARNYKLTDTANITMLKALELHAQLFGANSKEKNDIKSYFSSEKGGKDLPYYDGFLRTGDKLILKKDYLSPRFKNKASDLAKTLEDFEPEIKKLSPMLESAKQDMKRFGKDIPREKLAELFPRFSGAMNLLEQYRFLTGQLLGTYVSLSLSGEKTVDVKGKKVSLSEQMAIVRNSCDSAKNKIDQINALFNGKKGTKAPETSALALSPIHESFLMKEFESQQKKIQESFMEAQKSSKKAYDVMVSYYDFMDYSDEGRTEDAQKKYGVMSGISLLTQGLSQTIPALQQSLMNHKKDLVSLKTNLQGMLNKATAGQLKEVTYMRRLEIKSMIEKINNVLTDPSSPLSDDRITRLDELKNQIITTRGKNINEYIKELATDITATALIIIPTVFTAGLGGALGTRLGTALFSSGTRLAKIGINLTAIESASAFGSVGASLGMSLTDRLDLTNIGSEKIWSAPMLWRNFSYGLGFSVGAYAIAGGTIGILSKFAQSQKYARLATGSNKLLTNMKFIEKVVDPSSLFKIKSQFLKPYFQASAGEIAGRLGGPYGQFLQAVGSGLKGRVSVPSKRLRIRDRIAERKRIATSSTEELPVIKGTKQVPESNVIRIARPQDVLPAINKLSSLGFIFTKAKNGIRAIKGSVSKIIEIPKNFTEYVSKLINDLKIKIAIIQPFIAKAKVIMAMPNLSINEKNVKLRLLFEGQSGQGTIRAIASILTASGVAILVMLGFNVVKILPGDNTTILLPTVQTIFTVADAAISIGAIFLAGGGMRMPRVREYINMRRSQTNNANISANLTRFGTDIQTSINTMPAGQRVRLQALLDAYTNTLNLPLNHRDSLQQALTRLRSVDRARVATLLANLRATNIIANANDVVNLRGRNQNAARIALGNSIDNFNTILDQLSTRVSPNLWPKELLVGGILVGLAIWHLGLRTTVLDSENVAGVNTEEAKRKKAAKKAVQKEEEKKDDAVDDEPVPPVQNKTETPSKTETQSQPKQPEQPAVQSRPVSNEQDPDKIK